MPNTDCLAGPTPKLPGFGHIKRYYDTNHQTYASTLLQGDYYVTDAAEMIVTILGSCIATCVRDCKTGYGGMNHFMLPRQDDIYSTWADSSVSPLTRYGNYAMQHLMNDILKYQGDKQDLEIKVFGGGRILENMSDVGGRNIEFVHQYMRSEDLQVSAYHVGGNVPRKIYYFPKTGQVLLKPLQPLEGMLMDKREQHYQQGVEHRFVAADMELFG